MQINFKDALKAKKIREFFHANGRIYIVVDASSDDVQVPDFLRGDPALRLVLNTRMPQAIHIRDGAIASHFSFSGQAHSCTIPMHRIWAVYLPDGDMSDGIAWEEDIPEAIHTVMGAVRGLTDEPSTDLKVLGKVFGDADSESNTTETASEPSQESNYEANTGRQVKHLRVIK